MKMAKASTADIEMAMELSRFVEDLVDGMCPKQACADPASDDIEWLEDDPDEQHLKIISALQGIVRKGSIFRVTFGMSVLIDPRNELVDPDADTLEPHPKIGILADQVEALTKERDALKSELEIASMVPFVAAMSDIAKERDTLLGENAGWLKSCNTLLTQRNALEAAARLALDALYALYESQTSDDSIDEWVRNKAAIEALKAVL